MQALEGIKVIDFSKWLPGQYCGMVLADYGADVIKVEVAGRRSLPRLYPAKRSGPELLEPGPEP
jgi:crotonobetainyl-CoA:carnitine CoA-transferase CaiB-like acyl-CoA transferase